MPGFKFRFDLEHVRRDLRLLLPELSRVYGLKPWDVELMSFDEIDAYLADLERVHAEAQRVNRQLDELGG